MMKRTRGIIAIFLLLAMLLTACGQSAQTPTVVDEPEDTTPVVVEPEQEDTATEPLVFSDQPANVFRAKFEGSNVAGKGEAVDGVYRFTATKTDGEAWHVKLESNYMTVPGRDYRVTYHFKSDVAGTVKFGDFHEFAIRKGENTVTGQVSASNGYTYLDLQLGALKPFTIDFTSIEVEELETEADYESVMTVPIAWSSEGAVYVQHDPGYFYKLDRHVDGVTMKVEEIPFSAEVWMSRLYVKTAAILEPGALYRVSADVSATHEMDMEVCFNNGDNEKGYGAFYGQRMGDMSKHTFQQLIDLRSPGSEGGEVVLQFAFGKSPDGSQVTVDNIRVEKVHEHYTNALPAAFAMNSQVDGGVETGNVIATGRTALSGYAFNEATTVYGETGDEFAMAVSRIANGAVGRITNKNNDDMWNARLYVRTGVTPEAGKAYRVTAKVHSDKAFGIYELLLNNGSGDKIYEGIWGQFIDDGETKTYTKDFVAPADGCQELVLRLQMGASPVGNEVTLSDVHVYKLTEGDNLAANLSYPNTTTGVDFALETNYDGNQDVGTEAKLVRSGNSATVTVNQTLWNDDWRLKFYAKPGINLEAGKTYIVEMDVAGTTGYNICFKSLKEGVNDAENAFGFKWVDAEGHVSWWITPTAEKAGGMEILLKIGALANGSTVTVSNVKVFVLEDVTGNVEYSGEGKLDVNNNSVTVTEKQVDDWQSKFYIKPHVALEAGETYYADMVITDATGYDACYKSLKAGLGDAAETAFGSERVGAEGHVIHKITPTEANAGEMEILLKLGQLEENSTVTVNNVKVYKRMEELTATPADTTGGGNFFAEVMKGPAVGLTGNGSSATTKVVNRWDDWRIKSYAISGVTLAAGKTYKVSMKLATALGGDFDGKYKLYFKSEGKAEDAFGYWEIAPDATQTVGRIVTPNADNEGKLEIMMQLGNLPNGSAVTISDIQICEVTQGDELTHINYGSQGVDVAANDGYETSLDKAADKVQFAITKAPESRYTWDVKLNVRTSLIPQRGQLYRVSFDIQAEEDQGRFEVFYDGAAEKAYGEKYELTLRAGKPMTVTQIIDGGADEGALNVQIRLGETDAKTGNSYTVSNLRVSEVRNLPVVVPITKEATELWTHEDYAGTLLTTATSASARLTKTPTQGKEAWKTKLFVETGAKLQAGQKYRITFTVVGSNGMPYEICLNNGGEEKGLGGIFGLSGTPGGEPITYVTTPDKDIDLVLQFSLGNAASGNTLTVRNLRVEKAGASSLVSHTTYTF